MQPPHPPTHPLQDLTFRALSNVACRVSTRSRPQLRHLCKLLVWGTASGCRSLVVRNGTGSCCKWAISLSELVDFANLQQVPLPLPSHQAHMRSSAPSNMSCRSSGTAACKPCCIHSSQHLPLSPPPSPKPPFVLCTGTASFSLPNIFILGHAPSPSPSP